MQSLGAVSTGLGGSGARQKYLPPYLREPAPAPEPAPSALPAARTQVRIACTHGAALLSSSLPLCLTLSLSFPLLPGVRRAAGWSAWRWPVTRSAPSVGKRRAGSRRGAWRGRSVEPQ